MKNMLKKNQIMITALAIMIAVAGYLNFAGTKVTEEEIMTVDSDTVVNDDGSIVLSDDLALDTVDEEVQVMDDISDEDILQSSAYGDIESLDTDDITASADYLGEEMAQAEVTAEDTPGEAVFTSTANVTTMSGAKLMKEQTRAKNKETLLDIINSTSVSEEQKQSAIEGMIQLTDIAEKETAAEILLEAKGFTDVVVSISDSGVDVVVNAETLTDAQCAQIEDIVTRKTGTAPENIIIQCSK